LGFFGKSGVEVGFPDHGADLGYKPSEIGRRGVLGDIRNRLIDIAASDIDVPPLEMPTPNLVLNLFWSFFHSFSFPLQVCGSLNRDFAWSHEQYGVAQSGA
jgi:hypothetical protein